MYSNILQAWLILYYTCMSYILYVFLEQGLHNNTNQWRFINKYGI